MAEPLILADTSVWIDYLRLADLGFARLLRDRLVLSHPYVIGELALGSLKDRETVIADIEKLPTVTVARHQEVMMLIERHALNGCGIGYVDAHLLASTLLTPGTQLWTRDKRLQAAAEMMGVAAEA